MTPALGEKMDRAKGDAVCIVVMGVSGTGKSTLGNALSRSLGLPYIEGDDLHPPANIAKMSSGVPLNDEDREPWLKLIRERVVGEVGEQRRLAEEREGKEGGERSRERERLKGVVVACSSLKKYYRDILRGEPVPTKPEHGEPAQSPGPESLRGASPSTLTSASSPSSSSSPTPPPITSSTTAPTPKIHTYFAFISGPSSLLYARMEARPGHFMKASMLDSQLAVLEDPVASGEGGVVRVSIEDETDVQVKEVREGLRGCGWDL